MLKHVICMNYNWKLCLFCQAAEELRLKRSGVWSPRTLRTLSVFIGGTCLFYCMHPPQMFNLLRVFCFRPVHGLIFLFKWQPGEEPAGSIVQDSRLDHIFFAKQVKPLVL